MWYVLIGFSGLLLAMNLTGVTTLPWLLVAAPALLGVGVIALSWVAVLMFGWLFWRNGGR